MESSFKDYILTVTGGVEATSPGSAGYVQYNRPYTATRRAYSYKESVDIGKFIPNEYRVNPYFVSRQRYTSSSAYVEVKRVVGDWTYRYWDTGDLACKALAQVVDYGCPPLSFGSLPDKALTKAYAKVAQSRVGGGENLGEIRETFELLRDPFKSARDFLLNSKKGQLGILNKLLHFLKTGKWDDLGGRAALLAASATWLEFRYGLMPLLYSIADAMETVENGLKKFNAGQILTARSHRKDVTNSSITKSWGYNHFTYKGEFVVDDAYDVYANVQYVQNMPETWWDAFGLAPRFLPELAWELTRLSFVVDWWFSVGDWLGALRAKPTVTVLGNTVGMKVTRHVSGKAVTAYHGYVPGWSKKFDCPNTYVLEQYTRSVNQDLPIIPPFELDWLDLIHTIDSLALILQHTLNNIRR